METKLLVKKAKKGDKDALVKLIKLIPGFSHTLVKNINCPF